MNDAMRTTPWAWPIVAIGLTVSVAGCVTPDTTAHEGFQRVDSIRGLEGHYKNRSVDTTFKGRPFHFSEVWLWLRYSQHPTIDEFVIRADESDALFLYFFNDGSLVETRRINATFVPDQGVFRIYSETSFQPETLTFGPHTVEAFLYIDQSGRLGLHSHERMAGLILFVLPMSHSLDRHYRFERVPSS